ncbi:2',3'-cyclic-nucleotide 2'-phosphodiesterase, partial [Halomonas sp. SIMBA_159]
FPYINANVYDLKTGENLFTPYLIKTYRLKDTDGAEHDIKIGYIGFVPPQIMTWDKKNLEGKVSARDIKQTADYFVPKMKAEGADIIVAIPHSG